MLNTIFGLAKRIIYWKSKAWQILVGEIYKICLAKYDNDLAGGGAEKQGGSCNKIALPALYCSNSIARAALETLANPDVFGTKISSSAVTISFEEPKKNS